MKLIKENDLINQMEKDFSGNFLYDKGFCLIDNMSFMDCFLETLDNVPDAKEKGFLKELPCAIDQEVYTNMSMQGWYMRKKDRPYKAKVVFIGINGIDDFMNVKFENGNMLQFPFSQIGKMVFLTEEDAKKALEVSENIEKDKQNECIY